MVENAYDKRLGDLSEKLCKTIESRHDRCFDTRIFHDWAMEHAKDLYVKEEGLRGELKGMMDAQGDIEAFGKKALEWGKLVLKIYGAHAAWLKAQPVEDAVLNVHVTHAFQPPPQAEQGRLL